MKAPKYSTSAIVELLHKQRIASLPELTAVLGEPGERTVFRKLREVEYRASYSHCGRYYTLDSVAEFDELGLWSCGSVWFSTYGTLLSTAAAIVEKSDAGYLVDGLDKVVHVSTKDVLRKLIRTGRLAREKVAGRYLYCSPDAGRGRAQVLAHRARLATFQVGGPLPEADLIPDEVKASIVLFFSLLDERQRRLYAGLESLKKGRGGDQQIAEILGLDIGTVARGRRDLLDRDVELNRVRAPGGGRKPVEKKRRRSLPASRS